jgi:putative restriction endonuclease
VADRRLSDGEVLVHVHPESAIEPRGRKVARTIGHVEGYFGVTDPGWYEHLSRTPEPKDANFWRPSTRAYRLPVGTPFFFKLKAPHHAVAGFGFFAGFTVLPDWLAWDTFGESNGVADITELRARLRTIRKGARIEADAQGRIGCALIAESRFFARDEWIATPTDWKRTTQSGERFDLTKGEGARVWEQCLAQAAITAPVPAVAEKKARFGAPVLFRPRLGQGIFRVQVLDAYGRACAVTGEHSLPVLEAAHIKPYSNGGEHDVTNGLSLRSDLHRLFDKGYVTVDEDQCLVVGRRLKEDFANGRSYYGLQGTRLEFPRDTDLRPTVESLRWHRDQVFVG